MSESFKIIHPIHQHSNNLIAFVHALKLACISRGELEIVDVRSGKEEPEVVSVRAMLERWNVLLPGSHRSDVAKAGLAVTKIRSHGNPKKVIAKRMERHAHDVLVIGTQQKNGFLFFGEDLAEYLARYFRQTTLFVPSQAKPFVNLDTGVVTLNTIVMPIAESPTCDAALAMLARLLVFFPKVRPRVIGTHSGTVFPYISPALLEGLNWQEKLLAPGPIAAAIVDTALAENADCIIMSTNGRDTLSQKIIGSNTEQVLKNTPCPVIAVPVS